MSGLEPLMIAAVVGSVAAAGATIYAGNETKKASYEAAARDVTAGQAEFAASQRDAQERKLEGQLVSSRQQAVAAASGAGSGDDAPTIVKLMTETAKRSRYGEETTLAAGRNRQQTYIDTAASRRASGDASFIGSILTGVGQVASGVGKLA